MKFTNMRTLQVTISLAFLGGSLAQTPPDYSPRVDQSVSVTYGSTPVSDGSSIILSETTFSPTVDLTTLGSSSNSSRILALLDLDAPGGINGNKSYAPVLHWMTFVPVGQSTVQANASFANDIAPYGNPQPAPGTGMHRLLFLCYAEAPVSDFVMPQSFADFNATDITARVMFDIEGFTKDAGVSLVAANWFQTENTTSTAASDSTPEVVQESSGHRDSAQNALIILTAVLGMMAFAI